MEDNLLDLVTRQKFWISLLRLLSVSSPAGQNHSLNILGGISIALSDGVRSLGVTSNYEFRWDHVSSCDQLVYGEVLFPQIRNLVYRSVTEN